MKSVVSSEKRPIKLWLDDIEDGAMEQVKNLANLPFVFSHIAIMPDAHQGYGMPIGGVMATSDVIVPNAVGVDIHCGVAAARTSLTEIDLDALKKILSGVRKKVPVGFKHHKDCQDDWVHSFVGCYGGVHSVDLGHVVGREYRASLCQIGTLGGGNHFIEIQKGNDGYIWLVVHSGSRNIGFKVAKYYNELAIELNSRWFSSVPKEWRLAFLPLDSSHAQEYVCEMGLCGTFAEESRKRMIEAVQECVVDVVGPAAFDPPIDVSHNYAAMENHFGRNVMVHRKGATRAYEGEYGIIPGSQGTSSYIVKGKGNPQSFKSCSHGAGRKMGRKEARRTLDLASEVQLLDDAGIVHSIRTENDLDEAPGSYKDIHTVMENQEDLVDVVVELKPLAVIKG